jgi:DNA-directed RNA polymerase specialized sigma24 family protein
MTSSPPARAMRPPDEIRATIEAFTDLDWQRVRKAAAYWARAYGVDAEDVMQDALERAVDGSRQCPRDISIFKFLSGAMRSISGDERKAQTRRAEIHLVAEDGSLVVDPIDDRPNAAESAQSREAAEGIKQAVLGLFEDDLAAQTIVEGDMDGIEGEELRDLTGLDAKAFASKRRFVRRRIDRTYPKGWTS